MEIGRDEKNGILEFQVSGRLDAAHAHHLENELDDAIRAGNHRIQLDLLSIDYVSSAGIRTILKYYQAMRKLGGSLAVTRSSDAVSKVLRLAGLEIIFQQTSDASPADTSPKSSGSGGGVSCSVRTLDPAAVMHYRLLGDPAATFSRSSGITPTRLTLGRGVCAVGIGAFGDNPDACRGRFGEFLAVAGSAAYQPSDDSKTPDYSIIQGDLVPEAEVLYAIACDGPFAYVLRFDKADNDADGVPLAALASMALDTATADAAVVTILAESAGLVGATIKQSPDNPYDGESFFEHPGIRKRLSFSPERGNDRGLALVVGLVLRQSMPDIGPFVRPLSSADAPLGHFHAATFTYRALPKGAVELNDMIASVFEEQSLTGVLHLLNDSRPVAGAGDSLFARGMMWVSPLAASAPIAPQERNTP